MIVVVLLLLAALNPVQLPPVCDQVDLVEVNHFYDEGGKLVFDQTIFWTWQCDRYQVRCWRIVKHPSQLPQRNWRQGGYITVWQDGETMRCVRAKAYRETWTQYDPELAERTILPQEERVGLR